MAIFGLIKVPGEHETITISEWLGKNYLLLAGGAAVGYAMANFSAAKITSAIKAHAPIVGSITKAAISAAAYFLPRRAGSGIKTFGLGVSIGALVSLLFDIANLLTKGKVQEYGVPTPSWYIESIIAAKS